MLEKELYPPVKKYLQKEGYECYEEVKFLTRSIDLVGLKRKKIIAIELKVSNWLKALQQALTCRLCAQETYMAISAQFLHRVDIELLQEFGIGLIVVEEKKIEFILKAKKSKIIHKSMKNKILLQINGGE